MNRNCEYKNYGSQRVGIFIDTHNIYVTCKELFNSKIDYQLLLPELANERDIIIAKAYLIIKDEEQATPFVNALKFSGFDTEIKLQEYRDFEKGGIEPKRSVKKNISWDVGIALDIVKWISKLDVIVLVSGNGCHIETMKYAKSFGIRTEVAGFETYTSKELIKTVDDFVEIGPIKDDGNNLPSWLKSIQEKESVGNR